METILAFLHPLAKKCLANRADAGIAKIIADFFAGLVREHHVPHSPHPAQHLPQSRGRTHDHRKEEEEIDRKSRVSGFLEEVGF